MPNKRKTPKKQAQKTPLILARCAIIMLFIQWLRLMGGLSFTWTIWLGYLLILLCLLEAWFDPIWRKKWVRYSLTVGVILWAAWFTMAVVLARPNLEYLAWSIGGDYKEPTEIGGIKWRSQHFVDLRLSVFNKSDEDYDDLAINFFPDVTAVAMGQVSNLPGVTFINNNPATEAHTSGVGPDNKPFQQPFELSLIRPEVICNKLRPGQTLQVVIAVANTPIAGADLFDNMYGPKVRPKKMTIEVKLKRGQ
jgi:hypothetical protein